MSELQASTGGTSRTTIGLTSKGKQALDVLWDKNWFSTRDSAFKVAVAFAIANDIPKTEGGSFETVWNVGTLDRNGDFRDTISLLLNDDQPWDEIQRLGDAGLRKLAELAPAADVPTEILLDSPG